MPAHRRQRVDEAAVELIIHYLPSHLEVHGAQRFIHAIGFFPAVVALLPSVACTDAGEGRAGEGRGAQLFGRQALAAAFPGKRAVPVGVVRVHTQQGWPWSW